MKTISTMQWAAWVELGLCWIMWSLAFIRPQRRAAGAKKTVTARSSRIGIGFVILAYSCVWAFLMPAGFEKSTASLIASMVIGPPAVVLVWMATRHLDKQWRLEAALSEDHELIMTGPYRWLRHPIYASLFGMLLETGFAKTWWPMFVAGVVFYIVGTEIRIRAEDGLLAARFQDVFFEYKGRTKAYIPFIR